MSSSGVNSPLELNDYQRDISKGLQLSLSRNKLFVIVGSGVSLHSTGLGPTSVLSWSGLIEHGLNYAAQVSPQNREHIELNLKMLHAKPPNLEQPSHGIDIYLGNQKGLWLKGVFENMHVTNPYIYQLIAVLQANGARIISTNYDTLIEQGTGLQPMDYSVPAHTINFFTSDDPHTNKQVFHVHGLWMNPTNIVLSPVDYSRISTGSESRDAAYYTLSEQMRSMFAQSRVLFIGCGGTVHDVHFSKLLQFSAELYQHTKPQHVMLATPGKDGYAPQVNGVSTITYTPYEHLPNIVKLLFPDVFPATTRSVTDEKKANETPTSSTITTSTPPTSTSTSTDAPPSDQKQSSSVTPPPAADYVLLISNDSDPQVPISATERKQLAICVAIDGTVCSSRKLVEWLSIPDNPAPKPAQSYFKSLLLKSPSDTQLQQVRHAIQDALNGDEMYKQFGAGACEPLSESDVGWSNDRHTVVAYFYQPSDVPKQHQYSECSAFAVSLFQASLSKEYVKQFSNKKSFSPYKWLKHWTVICSGWIVKASHIGYLAKFGGIRRVITRVGPNWVGIAGSIEEQIEFQTEGTLTALKAQFGAATKVSITNCNHPWYYEDDHNYRCSDCGRWC